MSGMFSFLKRLFIKKSDVVPDLDDIPQENWVCTFSSKTDDRFTGECGDGYEATVNRAGVILTIFRNNCFAWITNPVYRYQDAVIEALIEFPDPIPRADSMAGSMAAGIHFRCLNDSTFYSVMVSDGGMIRLDAVVNETPLPVLGWTETAMGNQDSQGDALLPYHENPNVFSLRIIARGTSITLIVNDEWVAECEDDTIQAAGRIAFAAQTWKERKDVSVYLKAIGIDSRPMEIEALHSRWNHYLAISPEAHLRLATTRFAMGHFGPALASLKQAAAKRESGEKELLLGAQIYLAQGLISEAEDAARKALSLNPSNSEAIASIASALYLSNNVAALDSFFKTLPATTIENSAFLSNLEGHLLHGKGAYTDAARAYQRAGILSVNNGLYFFNEGKEWLVTGSIPQAIGAWVKAARIFMEESDYENLDGAIALLLDYGKEDEDVQALAGKYFYSIGETAQAEPYIRFLIDKNTSDSGVWYLYGMILGEHEQSAQAIEAFERAIQLEDSCALYHFRLAETKFNLNLPCKEELSRALSLADDNGWIYNLAALVALSEGDVSQADTLLHKARILLPQEGDILVNLGEVRRQQGRLDEILNDFNRDDGKLLHCAANLLVSDGRYEDAEDWYRQAQKRLPYDSELLTDRASNCIELDLLNEADDLLSKALDLQSSPDVYRLISILALRKGEFARSEVTLHQGLSEFPDNTELMSSLAEVYLSTGRPSKAEKIIPRLIAAGTPDQADILSQRILDASTDSVSCNQCGRQWRYPKSIPPQGILRITDMPPDDVPAGTCPTCQKHLCIGCAREHINDEGRFLCPHCGTSLKLTHQGILWILRQWQDKL